MSLQVAIVVAPKEPFGGWWEGLFQHLKVPLFHVEASHRMERQANFEPKIIPDAPNRVPFSLWVTK